MYENQFSMLFDDGPEVPSLTSWRLFAPFTYGRPKSLPLFVSEGSRIYGRDEHNDPWILSPFVIVNFCGYTYGHTNHFIDLGGTGKNGIETIAVRTVERSVPFKAPAHGGLRTRNRTYTQKICLKESKAEILKRFVEAGLTPPPFRTSLRALLAPEMTSLSNP